VSLTLIAKIPYAHPDDRDVSYVLYDADYGALKHWVVWTESSTGDRYWGHYYPYNSDREKEAMRIRAVKCMLYLACRKFAIQIDSEEAFA